MMAHTSGDWLEKAILDALRERVSEIVLAAAEEAAERVKREVGGEVDRLVLQALKHYSIEDQVTHLAIRVQKGPLE